LFNYHSDPILLHTSGDLLHQVLAVCPCGRRLAVPRFGSGAVPPPVCYLLSYLTTKVTAASGTRWGGRKGAKVTARSQYMWSAFL